MDQQKILLAVIKRAEIGNTVDPEEALSLVASFIDRLDKYSDSYQKDMGDLFSIGACIWQLRMSSPNN